MRILSLLVVLVSSLSFAKSEFNPKEVVLFKELAIRDALLLNNHAVINRVLDQALKQKESELPLFQFFNQECEDPGTGTGSARCWKKCTDEGYSSSSCASRCGVNTSAGSLACWDKCASEGYSSSSCASRCGIGTGAGSRACWNRCVSEGYSSSSCAGRCGTSTPEGSGACWDKCTSEGYSSSSCASRCGTN